MGTPPLHYRRYPLGLQKFFRASLERRHGNQRSCWIGEFSTLKILQAPNFSDFRNFYRAKLEKIFVVPANTFDNVSGEFPIGFFIWDTNKKEIFKETIADVYDKKGRFIGIKLLPSYDGEKYISDWLNEKSKNISPNYIGHLASVGNDFQNQRMVFLDNEEKENWKKGGRHTRISEENLIPMCIYLSVRHCIPADWLNDRDQFLYPNDGWQTDTEFQSDCLAYTLFHGQNRISSKEGINHWIPFTEQEVDAPERFASNFMTDFIKGKIKPTEEEEHQKIFNQDNLNLIPSAPLVFSSEAQAVFDAGKELWRYYMKQENINPNASLYDIREHFQGRNDKGKMNNNSSDETYTQLIGKLREALKVLAEKITPKVFEYGFLRK